MKLFKIASGAVAVLSVIVLGGSTVFATSPGQLAGGPGNTLYQVKDLTQNGSYTSNLSGVNAGDELVFSMELSNTEFGSLTNVILTATLPSAGGTSTATATTDLGGTSGTSSSVTFSVPSGRSISLESGTTLLYDGSGNVIRSLPNTVTSSGVNVGTINGSTTEFVNFKAKVNAPAPTPTPTPTPTQTQHQSQKQTVIINNASAKTLPNTGPGDTALAAFGGSSALGAAGRYIVLRRRR